ncbi:MAG TPA: aminoglycoside phosphotransferase family protein [Candidatus Dormibacteraeota bacterium]|nr:aminoglycoside phosphotransferase family protein [Candidatus Dormibacteraeota bacterium]
MSATSQPGGFSPGAALRLRLSDQRRAFVKAVGSQPNPDSLAMHREEARRLAQLPASAPVPRLLGVHDNGEWVAVVLEDIEGTHPHLPWRLGELGRVLAAIERFQARFTPCPVPGLPTVAERHRDVFNGWARLLDDPEAELPDWARRNLLKLAERERGCDLVLAGDTLLHCDLRADNLLFDRSGDVVFLDWPSASRGIAWFDPLVMAPSVAMQAGPDPEWVVEHHAGARDGDPEQITTLVVAMAGYFVQRSLQPAPPGLPTLRRFQAAQGVAAVNWAAARTGWR